jgi:hypothetical protein
VDWFCVSTGVFFLECLAGGRRLGLELAGAAISSRLMESAANQSSLPAL